jgi:hypothetical protein
MGLPQSWLQLTTVDLDGYTTTEGEYLANPSPDMYNWRWTTLFVVTFSPECLGFYILSVAMFAATLVIRSYPTSRAAVHRRVWVSTCHGPPLHMLSF